MPYVAPSNTAVDFTFEQYDAPDNTAVEFEFNKESTEIELRGVIAQSTVVATVGGYAEVSDNTRGPRETPEPVFITPRDDIIYRGQDKEVTYIDANNS